MLVLISFGSIIKSGSTSIVGVEPEIQDYIKTLYAVQPDDRISCEYGVRTVGLSCSSRSGMHPRSAHKCLYNLAKSAEK